MRFRRFLSALFVLSLAACSGGGGSPGAPPAEGGASRASRFADCEALRAYLAQAAATQSTLWERYGAVLETVSGSGPVPAGTPASDAAEGAADAGGAAAPEREYSNTNVQEEGVDEPDFVKTDGERLYVVTGGTFLVFDVWPPEGTEEVARVDLEGHPVALLVHGSTVLVLSQVWESAAAETVDRPWWGPRLRAAVFDVTDPAAPRVVREVEFEGAYVDARLVEGRAHLVIQTWIPAVGGGVPAPPGLLDAGGAGAEAQPGLDSWDGEDLLPQYRDTWFGPDGEVTAERAVCPCENVFQPPVPNGTGFVTIATLDLEDPEADLAAVSLLTNSGVVYGSQASLYLATPNDGYWLWWADGGEGEPRTTTLVHKFDLGAEPTYVASGKVEGWVLNPFSMSEHAGVFRIATTADGWWAGGEPRNAVHLLRQQGDELTEVGTLGGLGEPGERIYAVRFLGDRGFVVTFRQTDPLYTLDLSDPANPRVAGELHVPGFSTYLHPVDDDLLLAVGQDTSAESWGIKLSLYDMSDLGNPREIGTRSVGLGSSSEAQYNHKAFTYFPTLNALALPVATWGLATTQSGTVPEVFSGLYVYDVDPGATDPEGVFTLRGRIEHTAFYRDDGAGAWYYPEPVRRAFFIGEAAEGYFLYTVSARGLKVTPYDDLGTDLAALPLPAEPNYWYPVEIGAVEDRAAPRGAGVQVSGAIRHTRGK